MGRHRVNPNIGAKLICFGIEVLAFVLWRGFCVGRRVRDLFR
jgi:hypothetical protein